MSIKHNSDERAVRSTMRGKTNTKQKGANLSVFTFSNGKRHGNTLVTSGKNTNKSLIKPKSLQTRGHIHNGLKKSVVDST